MAKSFSSLRDPKLGLDDQFNFGKYLASGLTVLEIVRDDPRYISWIIANTDIKFYTSVLEQLVVNSISEKTQRRYNIEYHSYKLRDESHNVYADQDDWFDDVPF